MGSTQFDSQSTSTAGNTRLQMMVIIRNRNSASSQVSFGSGYVAYGFNSGTVVTGAENTAVNDNIVVTGTLGNPGETLTLEGYTIELLPGAN